MVEVALIDRVNDSEEDAIELANFLKPLNNEFKVLGSESLAIAMFVSFFVN
jgi:adenine C2-methylase RlmN of 23S rRNA A2503 and tRNA A37